MATDAVLPRFRAHNRIAKPVRLRYDCLIAPGASRPKSDTGPDLMTTTSLRFPIAIAGFALALSLPAAHAETASMPTAATPTAVATQADTRADTAKPAGPVLAANTTEAMAREAAARKAATTPLPVASPVRKRIARPASLRRSWTPVAYRLPAAPVYRLSYLDRPFALMLGIGF